VELAAEHVHVPVEREVEFPLHLGRGPRGWREHHEEGVPALDLGLQFMHPLVADVEALSIEPDVEALERESIRELRASVTVLMAMTEEYPRRRHARYPLLRCVVYR
jgi:hypothetical protein